MTGFYKEYDDTSGAYVSSAEDAAAEALVSKNAAAASATAAAASEVSAGNQATAASASETNAATSETNAATSATNAATSETNAGNSATAAAGSATSASTDAGTATTKASEASTSATNAATSETNAASSATNAATSETNAATSATNAASSATTASTQATNAASSATAAATSETNAGNSATAAATSETNAASSATSASGSATTATTKAGEAATSATNAATSETNAATSATNSANSATSAGTAQTAAEAARDAALAAFDSFDDRYLGPKASDPTVDNDGDALAAGMLYFNTTTDDMKVYEGSSWVNAYASLSGALIATNNLSDLNNAATSRTNLGLGTAATTASTDYATAAQADQTVALTGAGTTTISGTYPNFTITGAGTTYTAGTGITLTGTEFSIGQGVATTDSPAFAGLTVDTTTLAVDATNNRVGIGTSSPSAPLHVQKGSAGSSAFPSGDWAAKIFNQTDASTENGLVVANRWAAAASTAFEVGGLLDNGDGFDTFLKVDGSGQVGIGTASPTRALDIVGDIGISGRIKPTAAAGTTTAAAPRICLGYDWDTGFFQDTTNTIGFATAGSEAMRILADGKVGIGQTAPSSLLHIGDAGTPSPQLFIETTDGGGTPTGASLIASSSTGDVTLQNVSPSPNTKLNFNAATTTFQRSGSEKMRINTYGVGIGTTSPGLALDVEGQCRVEDSQSYGGMVSRISLTGGSYGYGLYVNNSSLGGTGTTALFTTTSTAKNVAFNNGGTTSIFATFNKYNSSAAGHIRMTSNVLQYQVLSDARAKENIVDAGDAGSKIDAIQVRQFDWIEGGLHEEFGFIAQELAPIVPLAVGGEPDGEEMMGVDASKLVPLLVKEIQSLRARVAALEE